MGMKVGGQIGRHLALSERFMGLYFVFVQSCGMTFGVLICLLVLAERELIRRCRWRLYFGGKLCGGSCTAPHTAMNFIRVIWPITL